MNTHIIKSNFDFLGKKVLIMGLGLNGGGVGIAKFFAKKGAQVSVTDLKNQQVLTRSIEQLKNYKIKFILCKHNKQDFIDNEIIIKGAGIKWDNHYIQTGIKNRRIIDTDIGIFFEIAQNPKIGITGSKGKSTTTILMHKIFQQKYNSAKLGGNIAVSPFEQFDEHDHES
ncbi:unnamed protein product, partial [marine sediment metagenome]